MKVTVQWAARNALLRYPIQADSLEKVQAVLLAREKPGWFVWSLPYKVKLDSQQRVTSTILSPTSSIHMPTWPQYRSQPQACQDEWDSMWKALKSHEKGHGDLFESALSTMVAYLENQQTMSSSECEDYLKGQYIEIDKRQSRYDTETDHGRSRGVELTISADCRSKP